ncbi:MAG: HdeD family acid-resistance protein [Gammaproteobacteria bacterium]|nr:MAG: HdeD family acid-resistance protein [Gammaproteobacteria bacterium]
MAMNQTTDVERVAAAVSATIHKHWVLFLVEGILLTVLGMLAILLPAVASLAATLLFGWLLLLSGAMGLVTTIRARDAPGFGWSLASALVGLVAGGLLLAQPVQGTLSLTAVLIAFLIAEGVVSIFYATEHRKGFSAGWGWMLVSGLLDLVLAVILLAGLPGTALWALGVLLGVNMIVGGAALLSMSLQARSPAQ